MSDYEYLLGAPALTNAIPRTDTLMRTSDSTLDRLVGLAAATLHVPVALLSLSFPDHELVLSGVGLPDPWLGAALPLARALGWPACAANEPVIADDVHTHPLLSTHPALRDLGLRTYASIPLRDVSGQPIGCLSIGDYLPRAWRPDEIARLHDMGALAADTLELRRWRDYASQLERALRESEERAQVVAETIDDVIVTIDTTGRIIFINSAVERLFGYAPEHVLGQSIELLMPTALRDAHKRGLRRYIASRRRSMTWHTTDLVGLHCDGHEVILETSFRENIVEGTPFFTGVLHDITERKRSEAALIESQARLQLLNSIAIGMSSSLTVKQVIERAAQRVREYFSDCRVSFVVVDTRGRMTPLYTIDPYTRPQLATRSLNLAQLPGYLSAIRRQEPLIVPDLASDPMFAAMAVQLAALQIGALVSLPLPLTTAAASGRLSLLVLDRPQAYAWATHEITTLREVAKYTAVTINDAYSRQERRRAEAALLRSEATTRALLDAIPDLMFRVNRQMIFIDFKASKGTPLFLPPGQFLQRRIDEVMPTKVSQPACRSIERAFQTGETQFFEYQLTLQSGLVGEFEARVLPSSENEVLLIVRDITERKHLESQLLQIQKIESVGQLAGGIAHDFNNLLTAIIGYADLAMMTMTPDLPALGDVEEIHRAAERAAGLTRQLLSFARWQVMELRLVRLNDLIFDLYKLLRRLIGEDIELIILPSYNEAWVKVDPGQIEQVLVNLAINARDAMPEGGKLTIEITHCSFDADLARRYVGASAGDYIVLTVSDSGVGMNDHVKAHLFEPFFTTKEKGRGTGLGLATCYGIIKQHSGLIDVASIVGAGTTISIFLPQARIDGAMVRSIIVETRGLPRGNETILLVEDEPAVRVLAARVLRAQGYIVLEAENGDEALSIAQQRGRAIMHLLLTDVVMPRMSGKMLAERMTALLPDLKVLFTSGYANDTIISQGPQPGIAFLQKPFTPATLARKVRDILDH